MACWWPVSYAQPCHSLFVETKSVRSSGNDAASILPILLGHKLVNIPTLKYSSPNIFHLWDTDTENIVKSNYNILWIVKLWTLHAWCLTIFLQEIGRKKWNSQYVYLNVHMEDTVNRTFKCIHKGNLKKYKLKVSNKRDNLSNHALKNYVYRI